MSTREMIIQAATQLFADKGYEGMTMKEIANEVGIKAPSLYAFYTSKEDIFEHICREVLAEHLQIAQSNGAIADQPVKEQLEQILHTIMEFQLRNPLHMKIYMRLLLFPPEVFKVDVKSELSQLAEEEQEMFNRLFRRAMDKGEIRLADPNAHASLLICLMDGLFWQMQRYDEATFWERFRSTWEQFWNTIT